MRQQDLLRKLGLGLALLVAWTFMPSQAKGGGLTALASFDIANNGSNPWSDVTLDADGNLYGTTFVGGATGNGTVWELAKGSSTITALALFDGTNTGANPEAGVTFDANGNLYGTAGSGGANNLGTVWELAKGSSTITALASFDNTNGDAPFSRVAFDGNGNLYGTTFGGGASGNGAVWMLAKGSSTITALASFDGTNTGANPHAGVTFDGNGNLYGTAFGGGANGKGTVWELAKGSSTITALDSFNGTNGSTPYGGATFDTKGNLYGTTSAGGASEDGTVWKLTPGGTITALDSFNGTNGALPEGSVTVDANGNLYGTALIGGTADNGTVWMLAPGGTITALGSFDGTNGSIPRAGVTFDANGNLFGTAFSGGANVAGTVWEITPGAVPEPSSIVMGLIGLALAGGAALKGSGKA